LTGLKVNYYRLIAGSLGLRWTSHRLKDYTPEGGGFHHIPPSAV
jgi:hypothetical protein